jgi:GMP synthase-like glutamine amidotransferase
VAKRTGIVVVNLALDRHELRYVEPFRQAFASPVTVVHWSDVQALDDVDGIVLSGQPVTDPSHTQEMVNENFGWVADVEVPLIGICGGHQVIGLIFGADLRRNDSEPLGLYPVFVTEEGVRDPLFKDVELEDREERPCFMSCAHHRDTITLPEGFVLLAATELCSVALMRHPARPIYGSQLHLENAEELPGMGTSAQLLRNFERLVLHGGARA